MSEEQVVDAPAVNVDVENEARTFGWVPKEEFRGGEAAWVDAETFVKRGKELNPILRKNNERLLKELEATKSQIADLKRSTEEFKEFQKEHFSRKEAELKSQIEELKSQKRQAIKEGDGDLAVDLDDQIDALKDTLTTQKEAAVKQPEPPAQEPVPQEVADWADANKWYTSDTKMRAATDALAQQLSKDQPWLKGKAFLDALDKELEDTFSMEKLGRRQKPRSPVEGSTAPSGKKNAKSYDNLPADAKAACDKFVKSGMIKSREEYVSMYDWTE